MSEKTRKIQESLDIPGICMQVIRWSMKVSKDYGFSYSFSGCGNKSFIFF